MPTHFISNSEGSNTDFVFLPDTLRFGADQQLTVVTGYLQPCKKLSDLAKRQMTITNHYKPVTYIVSYDAETNDVFLHCIDDMEIQHNIPLAHLTKKSLYYALLDRVDQLYGYTPKEVLNIIRANANFSPLP